MVWEKKETKLTQIMDQIVTLITLGGVISMLKDFYANLSQSPLCLLSIVAICMHNKRKTYCKQCGGGALCEHNLQRTHCKKCNGSGICHHGKFKSYCKQCNGRSICPHNVSKSTCKKCHGASVCKHDKIRTKCRKCNGGSICEHDKLRTLCKICGGGSICEHGKENTRCKKCGGSQWCKHNKIKYVCKKCDLCGYIASNTRIRINSSLNAAKSKSSIEYLGCDINAFKKHIETQFTEEMTWNNHGEVWHIDHIIPLKYNKPTSDEVIKRLHYTNTQPLLKEKNLSKGNRYIG